MCMHVQGACVACVCMYACMHAHAHAHVPPASPGVRLPPPSDLRLMRVTGSPVARMRRAASRSMALSAAQPYLDRYGYRLVAYGCSLGYL